LTKSAKDIEAAVNKAFLKFRSLGLVYDSFLIPKAQTGYDWSEQRLTGPKGTKKSLEIIFYEDSRGQETVEDNATIFYQALVRSSDFTQGLYDQIEVEKDRYNIVAFKDSLFIVELKLTRVSR
jgi:hypothetical protein